MKCLKNPQPFTPAEIPGAIRVVEMLDEELGSAMNRKRRSILNHTRKALLALLPPELLNASDA